MPILCQVNDGRLFERFTITFSKINNFSLALCHSFSIYSTCSVLRQDLNNANLLVFTVVLLFFHRFSCTTDSEFVILCWRWICCHNSKDSSHSNGTWIFTHHSGRSEQNVWMDSKSVHTLCQELNSTNIVHIDKSKYFLF